MNYSDALKQRILNNINSNPSVNQEDYTVFESAIIFKNLEDNFLKSSYESILTNSNWERRLMKRHSHFKDGTLEMQSSNSSDAILMNIFCNPGMKKWTGPRELLNIDALSDIEFGWKPVFENEDNHPTEIDMKIGNRIFESKLTEISLTTKPHEIVERYKDFHTVFDSTALDNGKGEYCHYQLIRNILTAYKYGYSFSILIDESRIDLIKELFSATRAIKDPNLRSRISFITWQEIASVCGTELKEYLSSKYF